jgi:hypothetical protein
MKFTPSDGVALRASFIITLTAGDKLEKHSMVNLRSLMIFHLQQLIRSRPMGCSCSTPARAGAVLLACRHLSSSTSNPALSLPFAGHNTYSKGMYSP